MSRTTQTSFSLYASSDWDTAFSFSSFRVCVWGEELTFVPVAMCFTFLIRWAAPSLGSLFYWTLICPPVHKWKKIQISEGTEANAPPPFSTESSFSVRSHSFCSLVLASFSVKGNYATTLTSSSTALLRGGGSGQCFPSHMKKQQCSNCPSWEQGQKPAPQTDACISNRFALILFDRKCFLRLWKEHLLIRTVPSMKSLEVVY